MDVRGLPRVALQNSKKWPFGGDKEGRSQIHDWETTTFVKIVIGVVLTCSHRREAKDANGSHGPLQPSRPFGGYMWAREIECMWDAYTCTNAAAGGDVDVLNGQERLIMSW